MEQFAGSDPASSGKGQPGSEAGKAGGVLEYYDPSWQRFPGSRARSSFGTLMRQLFDPLFCTYIAVWLLVHCFRHIGYHPPYINGWLTDFIFMPAVAHFARICTSQLLLEGRNYTYPLHWLLLAAIYTGLLCEWLLPKYITHTTGDVWDAVAYMGGALFFYSVHQKSGRASKST